MEETESGPAVDPALVTEILEEAAADARATYISAGLSGICADYVREQLKTGERRDVIVADVVEFLTDEAKDRAIKGGPRVRVRLPGTLF